MAKANMPADNGGGRKSDVPVDLPSNSISMSNKKLNKKDDSSHKVDKVISGEVVEKKKSLGSKLKEMIFGSDGRDVTEYIIQEVLVPAFKNTVSDVTKQGMDRLLYGSSQTSRQSDRNRDGYTSYNRFYSDRGQRASRGSYSDRRPSYSPVSARSRFEEYVLPTRSDAELVLDRLIDLIDQYGVASVSDFLDLIGKTGAYTDEKWGWSDLRSARIRQIREGYILDMPEPESI